MNLIGEGVSVTESLDPGIIGRHGQVILETAGTLLLADGKATITIAKKGTGLRLDRNGSHVEGDSIAGRLEDRLEAKRR